MPRTSAGLLPYRRRDGRLEVFLVHPGGPFWANKETHAWSVAKGEVERDENLFEIFRQSFSSDQGRTFLERPDGSRLSYGDLVELSGRVARVLQDLGVKPGERVGSVVERPHPFVTQFNPGNALR